MKRAIQLYTLFLKATVNKIRENLAREIVVGICAMVIFSLFFYVFNDFLNVEVKEISKNNARHLRVVGFIYSNFMGQLRILSAKLLSLKKYGLNQYQTAQGI